VSNVDAVRTLEAHRFPLALSQRPLRTLSPGERVRAALLCLMNRDPQPSLLILDEPIGHLDFLGVASLGSVLAAWPRGLVVISHDDDFLKRIGTQQYLTLAARSARLREDAA
jgi:ATPase subunit of ABC transporter with duplicated ATPase domains